MVEALHRTCCGRDTGDLIFPQDELLWVEERGLHADGEGKEHTTMVLGDEWRGRNGGEAEEVMAEEDGRAVTSLPPAMPTEMSTSWPD